MNEPKNILKCYCRFLSCRITLISDNLYFEFLYLGLGFALLRFTGKYDRYFRQDII